MPKYSEEELATVIQDMWTELEPRISPDFAKVFLDKHPVIDEIAEFGPTGPCGIGLGRYGGHAIGEDD